MGWHTIQNEEPSEEFGVRPKNRSIDKLIENGILIVDKPFGPTSNQVTGWIKKELNLQKAGHFGTLDPNATGVLPIGLNRGTRLQECLAKAKKEYIFEAELDNQKQKKKINKALKAFEGVNKQVPPEKSAVKKKEREREVYEIELLDTQEQKILGELTCESGFYVRVLVNQLGQKLGTSAEMTELRRTKQGEISEDETNNIQDIVDAYHFYKEEGKEKEIREVIHPREKAVSHLSKIIIKDSAVNSVANGSNLGCSGIAKLEDDIQEGDTIAIMTLKGELVAVATAEMTSEKMYSEEGTAANLESVHMNPELYPKRWKQ